MARCKAPSSMGLEFPLPDNLLTHYLRSEEDAVQELLMGYTLDAPSKDRIKAQASELMVAIRNAKPGIRVETLLREYGLDNKEGVTLMCLAEALLRIPDQDTAERFLQDRLQQGNWAEHLGHSDARWVNASTWGLCTLWQAQLEGNYLVLESGEHLYAADPSQGIAKNAFRDASLSTALLAFDILNLYHAVRVVFSTSDKATSVRNVTDLVGWVLGTTASISDFWKMMHSQRAYLSNAEKLGTTYGQVMLGRTLSPTALDAAKFIGYGGALAAGLGIAVSFMDFVESQQEGDAVMVVGGLIGVAGLFSSNSVLGPIGILVGLVGVLLKAFALKEDNLLQTWLEQGPFSENKPMRASHLIPMREFGLTEITLRNPGQDTFNLPGFETRAVMDPASTPSHSLARLDTYTPISHYLTAKFSTLKDNKGKPLQDLQLTGRILGSLILDQNYQPLGLMCSDGHTTSPIPKFWMQPHDNTIYIKQQSKLTPCAEIGKPMAANKAAVSQHLDNLIDKTLGGLIETDTSDRFSDRWWEYDDEEFTKPMTLEGHEGSASLELLQNGLFPVKTKLSMQALDANGKVMEKRFGRAAAAAGYHHYKG